MSRNLVLHQVPDFALYVRHSPHGREIFAKYFSETSHDQYQHALALAVGILAFPGSPAPYPKTHAVYIEAMNLLKQIHEYNQKLRQDYIDFDNHKEYHPSIKVSQNYDVVPPADWVHHERKLENERLGKTYHPPKMVGSKKARQGVKDTIVSMGQAKLRFMYD